MLPVANPVSCFPQSVVMRVIRPLRHCGFDLVTLRCEIVLDGGGREHLSNQRKVPVKLSIDEK